MTDIKRHRPPYVIGPLGEALTLASLPSAGVTRWVIRRKAEVVAAVNGGLLTTVEARERYSLTCEEFTSWRRAVERSGMAGLRVTRRQTDKARYDGMAPSLPYPDVVEPPVVSAPEKDGFARGPLAAILRDRAN